MKSTTIIKLLLVLTLSACFFCAKSKAKSETVLGFFNSLFTGYSEAERLGNSLEGNRVETNSELATQAAKAEKNENEAITDITMNTETGSNVESVANSNTNKESIANNEMANLIASNEESSNSSISKVSNESNLLTSSEKISTQTSEEPPKRTEGWLQISSSLFLNKNKFPPVVLEDGTVEAIQVNADFFRRNDAFVPNSNDENLPKTPYHFYFRVNNDNLYYSPTKTDETILGNIFFNRVLIDSDDSKDCFFLYELGVPERWRLCADDKNQRMAFVCEIKKELNEEDYICSKAADGKGEFLDMNAIPKPTVIEDRQIQPIMLIPLPSRNCNDKWDYISKGKDWECTCKEGLEQSPVDLPEGEKAVASPVTPLFQYEEISAKSTITSLDGHVRANEYIKIKYSKGALRIFHPNLGKIVTLDGAVYVAEEIVFHTPSEHTIEGRRFEMEMQVIHYGQSKGDIAKQVVLSFLFEKKSGIYNKFLDDIDFFNLPNPAFPERDITNNLFIPKIFYTSTDDNIPVMRPFSFYTYQGSITFPPCSEKTIHYVVSQPIPLGSTLLNLMKEALRVPDFKDEMGNIISTPEVPDNFRDVQPLNGRTVFFYDVAKYCNPGELDYTKKKEVRPSRGHYEKVKSKKWVYYQVDGKSPSGMPDSYIVSEQEATLKDAKMDNDYHQALI
jgi:carbonic anhydrase